MLTHKQARDYASHGFERIFKRKPWRQEVQILQGVALLETGYGSGWRGAGKRSWNMGGIQAGKPPCDPKDTFLYTDTRPTSSGANVRYEICFRRYISPESGFEDLARVVFKTRPTVLSAASRGNIYNVSKAMRETGYYEGYGKNQEERIANHHRALESCIIRIAKHLGEVLPNGSSPPGRTLRYVNPRMSGEDVKRVQGLLAMPETGVYDMDERDVVELFQTSRSGLLVDGIVGPQTWAAFSELEAQLEGGDTV